MFKKKSVSAQTAAANALYAQCIEAARRPAFYARLGVADTVDGRFDLIALHVALLARHLKELETAAFDGRALVREILEAAIRDFEVNLREMGVGDLSVGKTVRGMGEALMGRIVAYDGSLDRGRDDLIECLHRNLFRRAAADPRSANLGVLADYALAAQARLSETAPERFLAGDLNWPNTPEPLLAEPGPDAAPVEGAADHATSHV